MEDVAAMFSCDADTLRCLFIVHYDEPSAHYGVKQGTCQTVDGANICKK